MDLRRVWEERAAQWIAWARTPDHDAYWAYYRSFFEEIVPPEPGLVLEVGCGEGRVARQLSERASWVAAIDTSPTLLRSAALADSSSTYLIGDATKLPFADGSFDTVVAYNSMMDFMNMATGANEAARVLREDGRLCISVVHPTRDVGDFDSLDADARFVIDGSYFEEVMLDETFERDGLSMRFTGPHHTLSDYSAALEAAGLLIERIREPVPDPEMVAKKGPAWKRSERIPMFLFVRAVKP
jgi:SAM-dependent methyltransferase